MVIARVFDGAVPPELLSALLSATHLLRGGRSLWVPVHAERDRLEKSSIEQAVALLRSLAFPDTTTRKQPVGAEIWVQSVPANSSIDAHFDTDERLAQKTGECEHMSDCVTT